MVSGAPPFSAGYSLCAATLTEGRPANREAYIKDNERHLDARALVNALNLSLSVDLSPIARWQHRLLY